MSIRVQIKRERFEEEMAKRNLSGGQLSEMLGISHTHLSQCIRGISHPSSKIREKILSILYPLQWEDIFFTLNSHSIEDKAK